MSCTSCRITELIVARLAEGEKRVLSLTVAVRGMMQHNERYKGDLTAAIRLALRKLVAARQVVETDGMYSLSRR